MIRALRIFGHAILLWWGDFVPLLGYNLAWLALQIPILTGPPATAAMYVIARRVVDGETVSPRQAWATLAQCFWPAWRWGALNLLLAAVVAGNFWFYQDASGGAWVALRLAWGTIALGWFCANLFYWPFWLAQQDRRLLVALRNGLLLAVKNPATMVTLVVLAALLIVASVLTTLPFATLTVTWLALVGTLVVDQELNRT